MKKNQSVTIFLFAVLFLGICSCASDDLVIGEPKIIFPEPSELITVSMFGSLEDEEGLPLANALVVCENCLTTQTTTSDKNGDFRFTDIEVKGESGYITISSEGKFDAFRRIWLQEEKNNYTRIMMKDQTSIGTLTSSEGGQVIHESGASISMPANGIVDEDGQAYEGDYKVFMHRIDPTATDLNLSIVGDLSAITAEGDLLGLSTYGMLQVELESPNGKALNLKHNSIATLEFPIPETLRPTALEAIALWTYNEEHGYWLEEGAAIRSGDKYIGEVSHFSTWNVGFDLDPVDICGSIIVTDGGNQLGLPYLQVTLEGKSFQSVGGWLCDDGSFRFMNVPNIELVTLTIYDFCGAVAKTIELGPYGPGKVVLDPIELKDESEITYVEISGNALDCSANPLGKGYIAITFESDSYVIPLETDGNFNFVFSTCGTFHATVQVLDSEERNLSLPIVLTEESQSLKLENIEVCGDEPEEYIYFTFQDPIQNKTVERFYFDGSNLRYRLGAPSAGEDRYILTTNDGLLEDGILISINDDLQVGSPQLVSAFIVLGENAGDFTEIENLIIEFTDLGPLNGVAEHAYVEGHFTNGQELQGGFRLKFQ